MPECLPVLNNQRGSVLAGVVALSAILGLAASGYILISGQVGSDSAETLRRARLYAGAETAMQLGMRYVMKGWQLNTFTINRHLITTNAISHGWKAIDGTKDSVILVRDRSGSGDIWIEVWATDTVRSDTVRLRWTVDTVLAPTEFGTNFRLVMTNWKDTLFRKR